MAELKIQFCFLVWHKIAFSINLYLKMKWGNKGFLKHLNHIKLRGTSIIESDKV